MTFRHLYWIVVFCGAVFFGMAASAQVDEPVNPVPTEQPVTPVTPEQTEVPVSSEAPVNLVPTETVDPEIDWEAVATSAEQTMSGPKPSLFRLNRLRDELVTWRDNFAGGADINSGRLQTVQAQLDALGPVPENEDEIASIASRRDELNQQLAELRAPALLADEAHARANGLISEVDTLIRERDAQALTTRSQAPLNPTYWPAAFSDLGAAIQHLISETNAQIRVDMVSGRLFERLPIGLLFLAVAVILIARGHKWVLIFQSWVDTGTARGKAVWSFLLSIWELILPYLGFLALIAALNRLDVLGDGGNLLLTALFQGALLIILARWLNAQFFPLDVGTSPLRHDLDTRRRARRIGVVLAWTLAISYAVETLMRIAEPDLISINVILLPIQFILGLLLFRFGKLLGRDPAIPENLAPDTAPPKGRARRFVSSVCLVVAVATPVLAALGYSEVANAVFTPVVLTLAILGVVLLLQRFVNDLWELRGDAEGQEVGPLAPVLIGFVLFLFALPVLAITWGARVEDLLEIWTRFREGFSIGDTRISPSDFMTFALVFVIGYVLTRFIQGSLRTSVMPRTRLDLGGQNAVVAGFGYVGIILSVIIAITMAGIDLSSIAIVAGALSVGIGFGLQNIVSNFVSGIILLIERPIGEGDWIEVNGTMGYVRDISVRSTRIETFDRTDVIIPNADLVSGQVTNWTRGNAVGRVIVPVGVAYGTDTKRVTEILTEIAMAHPMVLLDPEPKVLFLEFGDNSLNFEIRAILRDVNWVLNVKSEMNTEINRRFADAGIEIPFPQRDLWIKNPDDLKGVPTS